MNSPPPRSPGGPPNPPPRRPLPTPPTEVNPFMDEPGTGARAQEAPNPFFDPPPRSGGIVTSAPPLVTSSPDVDSAPLADAPLPFEMGQDFDADEVPTPRRGHSPAAPPAAPSPRAAPSPPVRAHAAADQKVAAWPEAAPFQEAAVPQSGRTSPALPQGAPLRVQPGAVSPSIGDPHAEFRRGSFKKFAAIVAVAGVCGAGLYFGLPAPEPEAPQVPANTDLRANAVIGASVSPEIIEDPKKSSTTSSRSSRAEPTPAGDQEESPSASSSRGSQGNFANSFKTLAK